MTFIKIIDKGTCDERRGFFKDKECTILHREGGPALIWKMGSVSWWINGERHRENGPAIIHRDGTRYYYLNNNSYSKEGYFKELTKRRFGGFY